MKVAYKTSWTYSTLSRPFACCGCWRASIVPVRHLTGLQATPTLLATTTTTTTSDVTVCRAAITSTATSCSTARTTTTAMNTLTISTMQMLLVSSFHKKKKQKTKEFWPFCLSLHHIWIPLVCNILNPNSIGVKYSLIVLKGGGGVKRPLSGFWPPYWAKVKRQYQTGIFVWLKRYNYCANTGTYLAQLAPPPMLLGF